MTEPPVRHPFLLRLATDLLAKAERSTGTGPARLRLDRREAPELFGQTDAEAVQRWVMLLDDLCASSWVSLVLAPPREFAGFADRKPQLELRDFDALAAWAGYTPLAARWQRRLLDFLATRWRHPGAGIPDAPQLVLDYLTRSPLTALENLPLEDSAHSLEALAALCRSGAEMPLREASARAFQGRSKILDSREELLRLLGAGPRQFQEAPIQLLVDLPQAVDEVLFVENLVTFEHMADHRRPGWERSLLVYAAGFRGSAQRLRSRQSCRLYLRASPLSGGTTKTIAVEDWLFGTANWPVWFFGDLDYAGMQILRSLREVFANARAWVPGYGALAEALAGGRGHAPGLAAKELQIDPGPTGCPYADERLLPLLRHHGRFLDQEAFNPAASASGVE